MQIKGVVTHASTLALLVALAWTLAGQAQAQNATDQGAGAQAGGATTPADQSTAQNGAASSGQLQEVVVTAERRTVNIQQTPIVITALPEAQLQSEHISVVQDLQNFVPGIQVTAEGGYLITPSIRGVGTMAQATEQMGVAILHDGVLQGNVTGQDFPMMDVVDVETLEGPQGTFIGAGAEAGAIEVNSQNPIIGGGIHGYVLGKYGNYTNQEMQGAVNLPVTDTFAMRVAVSEETRESFSSDIGSSESGYYYPSYSATNPASDGAPIPLNQGASAFGPEFDPGHVDEQSERLKMLWKPTDNFQALGWIQENTNSTGGEGGEPSPVPYTRLFAAGAGPTYAGCNTVAGTTFTGDQLTCPGAGGLTYSTYYYPGERPYVFDYYDSANYVYNDNLLEYSLELRYTLPDGIVLRSLSGREDLTSLVYNPISNGPQNAGLLNHPNGPSQGMPMQEIDIISPTTGKVTWIAGAFWDYRDTPVPSTTTAVSSPYQPNSLPTTIDYTASGTTNRDIAVFGNIDWQFTNTLQLQIGVRENWDNNFNAIPSGAPAGPPVGTVVSEPDGLDDYNIEYSGTTPIGYRVVAPVVSFGQRKDSVPTGKVDLNWTPVPGQNFYAFYARGYKSGSVNETSTNHPTYSPEFINDWEAGWKGRVLDDHMATQIGVYYMDYQDYQSSVYDVAAANDTETGTYVANLPPSTIYGLSVSEQSRFAGFGIDLSYDYNHSSLGAINTLNSTALPAGFGSPTTLPQCEAGHTYIAPVECFNYTPYLTSVGGEEMPEAPENTGNISVDYLLPVGTGTVDPKVIFSHTDKQYTSIFQTAYTEMAARNLWNASIDWVVGDWDAQLYGTNLTDETYFAYNSGGTVTYGAPRQYGVQATLKF